ncbi:hypothetical protein EZS27_024820 [termite gut metagenome]|uniref:Uncharacterized protein n=1 Tax=termite gut metagenome TaxID=433724 RepID=A0A5J4QVR0_9ZZZZ
MIYHNVHTFILTKIDNFFNPFSKVVLTIFC